MTSRKTAPIAFTPALLAAALCAALTGCAAPGGLSGEVFMLIPEGCKMRPRSGVPGREHCEYEVADGTPRNIAVTKSVVPVSTATMIEASGDLRSYMENYLRSVEYAVTRGLPPVEGQRLITAESRILPPGETPAGLDTCLHFDFDFSDAMPDGRRLRIDSTGLRCLRHDPAADKVVEVMVEFVAAHVGESGRLPGFEAEARQILSTFRIDG